MILTAKCWNANCRYLPVSPPSGAIPAILHAFSPEELAKNYDGRVKFVKVDIEKSPEIAERYHVIAVPTILLFQDSQLVKKLVGFQERSSLRALLNSATAEK